jgi:TonB family protein
VAAEPRAEEGGEMENTGRRIKEREHPASANDAFKSHYSDWVGFGVIVAVGLHFGFFHYFPQLTAADLAGRVTELKAIELPPEVRVPPPPEQIARPATPRVAAAEMTEDVTIAPTTFESNPVENLPPPPPATLDPSEKPSFIPYDVAPRLKNPVEIQRLLQRTYPPQLREAKIEGKVVLWIYIDDRGNVLNSHVQRSSGYIAMDRVAQEAADEMEFTPAKNRDKRTAVWVAQTISFEVH